MTKTRASSTTTTACECSGSATAAINDQTLEVQARGGEVAVWCRLSEHLCTSAAWGTPLVQVTVPPPVPECSGYVAAWRQATSGQAFPQCVFDDWEAQQIDRMGEGRKSQALILNIHKRKNANVEMPKVGEVLDKLWGHATCRKRRLHLPTCCRQTPSRSLSAGESAGQPAAPVRGPNEPLTRDRVPRAPVRSRRGAVSTIICFSPFLRNVVSVLTVCTALYRFDSRAAN